MSADILPFPAARRVVSDYHPSVPPLWQMALLLQRHWEHLDQFERCIASRAGQLAMLGDNAPPKKIVEYMRYAHTLVRKYELLVPIQAEVIVEDLPCAS